MNEMVLVTGLIAFFAVMVYLWTVIDDKRMGKRHKKKCTNE